MCRLSFIMILIFLMVFQERLAAQWSEGSQFEPVVAGGALHKVSDHGWDVNGRGNHRAVVSVKQGGGKGVKVKLPWRRPDHDPGIKRIIVVDVSTGKEVTNVYAQAISAEEGSLAFQPLTVPGIYEIYYLPYTFRKVSDDARYGPPWNDYLIPEYQAEKSWLTSVERGFAGLPEAKVLRFEARKREDFFTSMGLIATAEEAGKLVAGSTDDFMIFPEDRAFPIRLTDHLPLRWTKTKREEVFSGTALKNEYYTFQLGVFAHKQALRHVRLNFSDLRHTGSGRVISHDSITCFNQEGRGWDGNPVTFDVDVPEKKVQALWLGVSVPADATAGSYEGWVTVKADHVREQRLRVRLHVADKLLADRGDDELWRHSRLRWLNSALGLREEPVAPYPGLRRSGNTLMAGGKELILDAYGLPARISNAGTPVLAEPLTLAMQGSGQTLLFRPAELRFTETPGKISWTTVWTARDLRVTCNASMTTEGSVVYAFSAEASAPINLSDIQLGLLFRETDIRYMMGIGLEGGSLPALPYVWNWKGPYDSFWAGSTRAGLHLEFQKASYNGPLLNDYKPAPPAVWANSGKGQVRVSREDGEKVLISASTGAHGLQQGESFEFGFKLLITPVKERNTKKHFSERYYQGNPLKVDKAAAEGANVINIHHNTTLNPYINYPFIERDKLQHYVQEQHAQGRKVKLYYTIRELSNYAPEIYALKSLGNEIFPDGPGQGSPWLWEHLHSGYKAAWYAPFADQTADASIVTNGFSRWINYYVEGLKWMIQKYQIDGLYLDDVAYDREVIARLRRVLFRYNPDALLDLHSNNNYSVGPANQYTSFFPYIDRLWFGEFFKYDKMSADQWLVQVSGIPFGLMGEMLEGGGNKWLGMVYGMSVRHSWGSESPAAIWKYWKDFDIAGAKMYGYWEKDCPVKSDNDEVKITVYEQGDKLLLAIGNFSDSVQDVTPVFKTAGVSASGLKILAPEIEGFQKAHVFNFGRPIRVEPRKGWLMEVRGTK